MIFFINNILSSVVESISPDFESPNITEIESAQKENIQTLSDKYILREENTPLGSLITFKETNKFDEWAFVLKFTRPATAFPEKASLHFWYTNTHLNDGDFFGKEGTFVGLMAGLEQHGAYTWLLLSINGNEQSYNKEDPEHVLREELPLNLLKNVSEIEMKVIYTRNNFKVEIYDKDRLIYDHLRIYSTDKLGHLRPGMHMSISADYFNIENGKYFVLSKAQLFSRNEDESYDRYEKKSKIYLDGEDKELQHAISALEYFMNYVMLTFGTQAEGTTILRGMDYAVKDVGKSILNLENIEKRLKRSKNSIRLGQLPKKFNDFDAQVSILLKQIQNLEYAIKDMEIKHKKLLERTLYLFGVVSVVLFLIYLFKSDDKSKND